MYQTTETGAPSHPLAKAALIAGRYRLKQQLGDGGRVHT